MKILIIIFMALADYIFSCKFIPEDELRVYNIGWLVGAAMVTLYTLIIIY